MAVQWLRLCTFTAEGLYSISGQGTKINPAIHAPWPPSPPKKKKITISLTVFTALYISSLRLIYFVSRNLYLLISLPHFTPPQPASPLATMFVLCMCVFLFCYVGSFVFQIPCLSEIIWYVSLFFSSSLTSSFLPSLFSSSYLLHGYQHLLS